jgi:hypothetical protein
MKAAKLVCIAVFIILFFFVVTGVRGQSGQYPPSANQQDGATGRSGTSRSGGQTGNPASVSVPAVNPSNPAPGVVDVFKKAGGFFGR